MNDSEDRGSVGEVAGDAAGKLRQDAEQAMGEIRSRGVMGFFSFDGFYFPVIARCLFIILFILAVIGIVLGVIGGLVSMVSLNFIGGFIAMIGSVVGGILGIIGLRIWFEMLMVAFKINENLEKVRDKC